VGSYCGLLFLNKRAFERTAKRLPEGFEGEFATVMVVLVMVDLNRGAL